MIWIVSIFDLNKIDKKISTQILQKKSRPAFSELFSSPFGFCNSSYVNNLNAGIFKYFKLQKKIYLHKFCRKKPASIFGIFLLSIQILQQLLCHQYKLPAFLNLSNFKKRNIYTIFAEKSRPAFSELFSSPFGFCNSSYVNNINGRHFLTFQTSK